ncbi:MAG TPA: lipoprotein insertase outer membrane protein LolB [Paucimonas sp.]|nr:lipoprotein insertase outer membrane protein LolB [Paucimonas sp.]
MSFRPILRHAAFALPLLLTACAGIAPPAEQKEASTQQAGQIRSFHEAIDLGGRLSVRYERNGREEALHGSFDWHQTGSETAVTLLSPLGQTIAIITVTPAGAALQQSGQPPRSASDVDSLTAQTLGWPLPVAGLREWLQGFALDRHGRRVVATSRTPRINTPDGWQIRYENWEDDATPTSQARPKRIDLSRYTEQAGEVSIRIVIDSWQAH